jgi:glycerol-3-phosphate dehydrogenase
LQVLELLKENPSWKERIAPQLPAIQAELVYCIRYELAETVEDLLARRTGAQMHGWNHALRAAPTVSALLAREKGWDITRTEAAVSEYSAKIRGFMKELELSEA